MRAKVLWVVIVLAGAVAGYIRLAPSDPARWHVAPVGEGNRDMPGGVFRVISVGPEGLARVDAIAQHSPRTTVLAGSVEEGMVTYVTRSLVMGFPDYTTVQQAGETLRIHARLRFGQSDMGVNKTRVEGWLGALQ